MTVSLFVFVLFVFLTWSMTVWGRLSASMSSTKQSAPESSKLSRRQARTFLIRIDLGIIRMRRRKRRRRGRRRRRRRGSTRRRRRRRTTVTLRVC